MKHTASSAEYAYRRRPLHVALVISGHVGRLPTVFVGAALLGLSLLAARSWPQSGLRAVASSIILLAMIGDGVSLALLPQLGRSYGPVSPPLLALALVRTGLTCGLGLFPLGWTSLPLLAVVHLTLTAIHIYATWVEPFRGAVTSVEITSPKLRGNDALLVLHVTDIHFEGWTPRELWLLKTARELEPDLIVLTGDYLSLSTVYDQPSQIGVRELLASLASLAPTYAVTGSIPVDPPDLVPAIFQELPIRWLLDEVVEVQIGDQDLSLVGLRCTRQRHVDGPRLRQIVAGHSKETFSILLYHSPDLMPDAEVTGIDLYLTGHTHGGQLCLPFFGAIITSSDFGKKYEKGLYQAGGTWLYVNRGLGLEGLGAPRARFLAPPELVAVTLRAELEPPGVNRERKFETGVGRPL